MGKVLHKLWLYLRQVARFKSAVVMYARVSILSSCYAVSALPCCMLLYTAMYDSQKLHAIEAKQRTAKERHYLWDNLTSSKPFHFPRSIIRASFSSADSPTLRSTISSSTSIYFLACFATELLGEPSFKSVISANEPETGSGLSIVI